MKIEKTKTMEFFSPPPLLQIKNEKKLKGRRGGRQYYEEHH